MKLLILVTTIILAAGGFAASSVGAMGSDGQDPVAVATPLLTTFWTTLLAPKLTFVPPPVSLYGVKTANTLCGPLPKHDAVYCPNDGQIYLNTGLLASLINRPNGVYTTMTVLAHEWGHAVEEQTGILTWAMESAHSYYMGEELQADCFAGMFDRYAEQQGALSPADVTGAWKALASWGDLFKRGSRAAGSHGTPKQRVFWFNLGRSTGDPNQCFSVYKKLYG